MKGRGLDIYKCVDIVGTSKKTFVPILNKEVESKVIKETPGLQKMLFPDGSTKFIHYDQNKIKVLLESFGHLLRTLQNVKTAVIDRGLGFIPGNLKNNII